MKHDSKRARGGDRTQKVKKTQFFTNEMLLLLHTKKPEKLCLLSNQDGKICKESRKTLS
jgi:hypothetical protein